MNMMRGGMQEQLPPFLYPTMNRLVWAPPALDEELYMHISHTFANALATALVAGGGY